MASSKTTRSKLPKQFESLLGQAQTQGALRYGAQETGLQSLLGDRQQTYQRQSAAQAGATRSLLGSYASAGVNLNNVYSDAGLTPDVRAKYAATPDGQRILASLARGQGDIQQQTLGAQAGGQFVQQRLGEDYQSDVGKIQDQQTAERTERGLYESSLLDQLIGDNRAARSKLNADARNRQAAADAATQSQTAAQTNALIGQGLLPGTDGTLQPLPGGKADPNAPGNQPKDTWLPQAGQNSAKATISKAVAQARRLLAEGRSRGEAAKALTEGRPGQQVVDGKGNKINIPGVPSYEQLYASIALDLAYDKHISRHNVQELHAARIKVKPLGYATKAPPKAAAPSTPGPYDQVSPSSPSFRPPGVAPTGRLDPGWR